MRSIHILLVEDNEGDILLTTEALHEGKVPNELSVVKDGEDAINFLGKKGKFGLSEQPDLVLLDVNLPKKNGHEVLQYIRKNADIKHIPVIMLTTSSSEKDILLSNKNQANCYITKPVEPDSFLNLVTQIEKYRSRLAALPSENKTDGKG